MGAIGWLGLRGGHALWSIWEGVWVNPRRPTVLFHWGWWGRDILILKGLTLG